MLVTFCCLFNNPDTKSASLLTFALTEKEKGKYLHAWKNGLGFT